MNIKNQKEYFNNTYERWKEISNEKDNIINKTVNALGISKGDSVLDVASGVGVLYAVLKYKQLSNYVALDIVFSNAKKHLKNEGTFAIVHARTREGLKEHHKKVGFNLGREVIPSDDILDKLVKKYDFKESIIEDDDFFYFSCIR
jgi:cyclopropane fatty-acyl-phospholipid synthase-like methyltransferase